MRRTKLIMRSLIRMDYHCDYVRHHQCDYVRSSRAHHLDVSKCDVQCD